MIFKKSFSKMRSFLISVLLLFPSLTTYTPFLLPFAFAKSLYLNLYFKYCFVVLWLFGVNIHTNENILTFLTDSSDCVSISNHLSEMDYIVMAIINSFNYTNKKPIIVMKGILRYVLMATPWSLLSDHIYVKRNFDQDKLHITKVVNYLKNKNTNVMIFPEGGIFTDEKFLSNFQYCTKNNLKRYYNLLHPRTKGCDLIQTLLDTKNLYDITILYDTLTYDDLSRNYNFKNIVKYNIFPKNIYIDVQKHNISFNNQTFSSLWDNKDEMISLKSNHKDKFISNFPILLKPNMNALLSFLFYIFILSFAIAFTVRYPLSLLYVVICLIYLRLF